MLGRTAASFLRLPCCRQRDFLSAGKWLHSLAASYVQHGDPADVVRLERVELAEPKAGEVRVRLLAAPINPSDINQIQGKYAIQPPLPAIAGNEGVGEVEAVGPGVSGLSVGDRVVPTLPSFGTWRSAAVCPAAALTRISADIPVEQAAMMAVNPCTALRMLSEFVELRPGETVVQNGATSAVGHAVVAVAKAWGLRSINIIRDRPDAADVARSLLDAGADVVLTETEARKVRVDRSGQVAGASAVADGGSFGPLPAPSLGLNCVSGRAAGTVAKVLRPGGTLVTYGGMSMEPVTLPTSLFIFSDLRARGFWLSRPGGDEGKRMEALEKVSDLIRSGKLHMPCTAFPLSTGLQAALGHAALVGGGGRGAGKQRTKALLILGE